MNSFSSKDIISWSCGSAIGYQVIYQCIRKFTNYLIKNTNLFNSLSDNHKQKLNSKWFGTCIISLINCCLSSSHGIYKLLKGTKRFNDNSTNYESVSLINGYLIADFINTINESTDTDFIFHHIIGISAISGLMISNIGSSFYPDVELMEISTIFLNLMTLFRGFGKTNGLMYKFIQYSFVLSFFITRIIGYPITLYSVKIYKKNEWNRLPFILKYCFLYGLYVLNLFWFYKILKTIIIGRKKK